MIRKIYRTLLLVSLLVLGSCQQENLPEPYLTVSQTAQGTLKVSADASIQYVSIETNQTNCQTQSNAPWVEVSQPDEKRIVLAVSANTSTAERSAEVMIYAGRLQRKIHVVQAGMAATLSVENSAYDFGAWEEEYEIFVSSTVGQWSVDMPETDWLSIDAQQHLGRILVKVKENRDYEPREVTMTLNHSAGSTSVLVRQAGALKFYLPFFEWGKNYDSFDSKEFSRGSVLVEGPLPATQVSAAKPFYVFETGSRLFPFVKYEVLDLQGLFLYRIILLASNDAVVKDEEFINFLKTSGFEQATHRPSSNGYTQLFFHTGLKTRAMVSVSGTSAEVVFTPMVEQPQAYQTFTELFYGNTNFNKATKADITEYEKSIGGVYSVLWTNTYKRQTGANIEMYLTPEPFYARSYIFNKNNILIQTSFFTDRLDVGMYKYGKLYYLTRELQELLHKEGFILYDIDLKGNAYIYVNTEKMIGLWFYNGSWNGREVLAYNVLPIS